MASSEHKHADDVVNLTVTRNYTQHKDALNTWFRKAHMTQVLTTHVGDQVHISGRVPRASRIDENITSLLNTDERFAVLSDVKFSQRWAKTHEGGILHHLLNTFNRIIVSGCWSGNDNEANKVADLVFLYGFDIQSSVLKDCSGNHWDSDLETAIQGAVEQYYGKDLHYPFPKRECGLDKQTLAEWQQRILNKTRIGKRTNFKVLLDSTNAHCNMSLEFFIPPKGKTVQ